MKNHLYLVTLIAILILPFQSFSQKKMSTSSQSELKKYFKYGKKFKKLLDPDNFFDCYAYSKSASYCSQVAPLCNLYDYGTSLNIFGFTGMTYKIFKLYDIFQPYCGDGECFQCCWNGRLCHTSFIGFPVINCNKNYGPETTPAGITLIVDQNPRPGQICLFTGQVCNHIAKCNSALSATQITTINNDPNHIMKSKKAVEQRAYSFAKYALESSYNEFVNSYMPGKPLKNSNGDILDEELTEDDISDFMYGRGHEDWSDLIDSVAKYQGNTDGFRIIDTLTKEYLPLPSMWNASRQFFLGRYLSMIPNLYNRLAFVESKVWTEEDRNSYLKTINYTDSTFLKYIHPIGVSILSKNYGTQDYRLLSVPLPGESLQNKFYNGEILGDPPLLDLVSNDGSYKFTIKESGTHQLSKELPILILWGDGTSTETSVLSGKAKVLTHEYPAAGEYRIIAYAKNTSGLRSILMRNVTVNKGNTPQTPTVKSFIFNNLRVFTGNFTFINYMSFEVFGKYKDEEEYKIGRTRATYVGNAASRIIDSSLVANNLAFHNLDKIIIKPVNNFNGSGYIRLEIPRIQGTVFNNSTMSSQSFDIKINQNNIKLYDDKNNLLNSSSFLLTSATGGLNINIQSDRIKVSRIEITFTEELLKQYYTEPNTVLNKDEEGVYTENSLDDFYKVAPILSIRPSVTKTSDLFIYPNPTEGKVVMNKHNNPLLLSENASLKFYTLSGAKVKEINLESNQNYYEFDINELGIGLYLWVYEGQNGSKFQGKIMKK